MLSSIKTKKNKNLVIVTIVLFMLVVFLFLHLSNKHTIVELNTDPALISVKQSILELYKNLEFQQMSKEEQLEKVYAELEKIPDSHQQLKHQYQVAMSSLPDITFYGRIIDQNGQPVKNARIGYTGENAYISAGGGMGAARTDDDGYFMIDTSGAALELNGVGHEEIDFVMYEIPIDTLDNTKKRYSPIVRLVSHDKKGAALNYNNYSEKNKAFTVYAWRLGEYEGAISGSASSGLSADGNIFTLKLDELERRSRIIEGEKEGHFHVSCVRPHIKNYQDYLDWSFSLVPINGGIQETDDLYMNTAPETGYQSLLKINMRKGSKDYKEKLLNKRYYFTTHNGKNYGSLLVNIVPFASVNEEACSLRLNYKINPTGSRNLELKRDNTSRQKSPSAQSLASN